jgi:hypothetical protein
MKTIPWMPRPRITKKKRLIFYLDFLEIIHYFWARIRDR